MMQAHDQQVGRDKGCASPGTKKREIEDMFKNAPKRFERKPGAANGASMDAMLARAGMKGKPG